MECIYLPDIWNLRSNQDINNFRFPTQILFLLWRIPPCVDINIPSPRIRFSHAQSQVAGPGPGKPVYGGQCNGVPLPDMNYEAIKREIVPILHNNHSMARHFLTEEKRYTVQSTVVQFWCWISGQAGQDTYILHTTEILSSNHQHDKSCPMLS